MTENYNEEQVRKGSALLLVALRREHPEIIHYLTRGQRDE